MTIKRITNTSLEANRVILRPHIEYTVSGSDITGSIPLIPNPSPNIRVLSEVTPDNGPYTHTLDISNSIEDIREEPASIDKEEMLKNYLNYLVTSSSLPSKNSKEFNIAIENVPGIQYYSESSNLPRSGSLPSLVNSVLEREIESNRNMEFGFTNYNCLGFVSGGNGSVRQALVYKDNDPSSSFKTFGVSFFVKPPSVTTSEFRPATIFHIDNLITVSLVSGSTQDRFGNTDSFKIVSQLTSSNENRVDDFRYDSVSDISTNNSVYSNFEKQVVFTPNNVIKKNSWYHVAIAISSDENSDKKDQNIYIDGALITGSISELDPDDVFSRSFVNTDSIENSHIMIGNKVEKSANYDHFFVEEYADYEKYTATIGSTEPSANFESPFFGEVHEVVFATCREASFPVANFLGNRSKTLSENTIAQDLNVDFYLPVLFGAIKDQKLRSYIKSTTSQSPIIGPMSPYTAHLAPHENTIISNDMRFPEVNITSFLGAYKLESSNYTRTYPRCVGMESISDVSDDENFTSLNDYDDSHDVALELSTFFSRNNLIRSCDNSIFSHDYNSYEVILEEVVDTSFGKEARKSYLSSSFGNSDISHVSMKNYINFETGIGSGGSLAGNPRIADSVPPQYSDFLLENSLPFFDKDTFKSYSVRWSPKLFAETAYRHSNLVTVIDIPQMFYSNRIYPGTFEFIERDLEGSNGMLTYNIKDNGLGALYRNDAAVSDTRNKCGIILYELGIVILTHPSLCMVGRRNYTIKFRGEKDLNVLNLNAHIGKYEFNESSNPSYNSIGKAGSDSNQNEIVMITGIEYLDDNLNVIMKSNLSQPVSKREFDEIMFRSRIDF
jgi:hypothetical protein